jgi:nucleotide-binding universal stress UspA family protein
MKATIMHEDMPTAASEKSQDPQQEELKERLLPARIVVGMDASPQSLAALQAAAELASLIGADLEGFFVEDINLIHLCGFSFGHEYGSYTARRRRLDNLSMEREMRALARTIQRQIAGVAEPAHIHWTFQVRRGQVARELLAAAQNAAFLSLGRASQARRRMLGSNVQSIIQHTTQPVLILGERNGLRAPFTVLFTGSVAGTRALRLAAQIAGRNRRPLQIIVWTPDVAPEQSHAVAQQVEALLDELEVPAQIMPITARHPLATLDEVQVGTLIISNEQASLLAEYSGPTIITP